MATYSCSLSSCAVEDFLQMQFSCMWVCVGVLSQWMDHTAFTLSQSDMYFPEFSQAPKVLCREHCPKWTLRFVHAGPGYVSDQVLNEHTVPGEPGSCVPYPVPDSLVSQVCCAGHQSGRMYVSSESWFQVVTLPADVTVRISKMWLVTGSLLTVWWEM